MSTKYLSKVFISDENNPPFNYLLKDYSKNIKTYSELADIIYDASVASATKLSSLFDVKTNDNLVHFFYDLYLALNSKLFVSKSNGDTSAIIDGLHFKYFGQPSLKIINSQIQLLAEKEICFLSSFFEIFKGKDFPRLLAIFAFSNASDKPLGMSDGVRLAKHIMSIIQIIKPQIEDKIIELLNN